MKMIGKPYAGELQVRFDEGEQDFSPRTILNGHDVGNDGYGQGSTYRMLRLFSTLPARFPSEITPYPLLGAMGLTAYVSYDKLTYNETNSREIIG
jgi:hypothetical protein